MCIIGMGVAIIKDTNGSDLGEWQSLPQMRLTDIAKPFPGSSVTVDSVCRNCQPQLPPQDDPNLKLFLYEFLLLLQITPLFSITPPPHSAVYHNSASQLRCLPHLLTQLFWDCCSSRYLNEHSTHPIPAFLGLSFRHSLGHQLGQEQDFFFIWGNI